MISSFFRNLLIARKHSLCIVKSRESMVQSQYKCARSASRACVVQQKWHCDVKSVPALTQIRRRFSLFTTKEKVSEKQPSGAKDLIRVIKKYGKGAAKIIQRV